MQDPERFLDEGTEFERALLRGGASERPSARTLRRMALGAGIGGALSYTSSAQALLETWWGKAAAIAVVGGGALAGVVAVVAPGAPSSAPDGVPTTAAALPRPAEPAKPEQDQPRSSEGTAQQAAPRAAAPPVEAISSKRPQRASKAASTLSDEIKLLDRARGLLARGDRAAALAELDGYDRRYPKGTLRREASVLRARATD